MNFRVITLVVFCLSLVSCKLTGIKGNGDQVNETREVDDFNKVDVSGNFEVELNVGTETNLEIIAESNLMKYIRTKVKHNTLFISSRENLRPKKELRIMVSVPMLKGIECSGANEIYANGIDSDIFNIDLSGAGSIEITGHTNSLYIDVSGAADLSAKRLITENVDIDVSGAANAQIYAINSVEAEVSGAGYIELYGDAKDVKMDVSGAGSLERK